MNGIDVLKKASGIIHSGGLAIGRGFDGKGYSLSAALVEAAYEGPSRDRRWDADAYLQARQWLSGALGIGNSYDAIADWNDSFKTSKDGKQVFTKTVRDATSALNKAISNGQNYLDGIFDETSSNK